MKLNLKILFLSFFFLQLGYFLSSFPEDFFANKILYLVVFFLFSFAMLIVCIELYYMAQGIIKNAKLNAELSAIRQQKYLKEEQTSLLIERKNQTQLLQENMTDSLNTFRHLLEEGSYQQASSYLDAITGEFRQKRFRPCCSDSLLNAILESKRQFAVRHQIQITYELLLPKSSLISVTDLSCIFFNLLDNGIEACIDAHTQTPFLRLSAKVTADFLSLHMCNSKNPHILFDHTSSKPDASDHGFGLSIIEDTASRNDGICNWRDNGDTFDSVVLLRYRNPGKK